VTRRSVLLLPDAEAEIREAFLWYRDRSAIAAEAFLDELSSVIDDLQSQPDTWPEDEDGVRHCILRRFPFNVYYVVDGRSVTVLAVAHHRRMPGYWRAR